MLETKPSKHSVETFGEDYGSYCAAWEDGACSDSIDLKTCVNGPGHTCGTKKGCHELWNDSGYNFNEDQLWCVWPTPYQHRHEEFVTLTPFHVQVL